MGLRLTIKTFSKGVWGENSKIQRNTCPYKSLKNLIKAKNFVSFSMGTGVEAPLKDEIRCPFLNFSHRLG